jgi:hypothetical protein
MSLCVFEAHRIVLEDEGNEIVLNFKKYTY